MHTMLDMLESPCQADPWLPEEVHTSTSVTGYDGEWVVSVAAAGFVEAAWNADNPIKYTDASGMDASLVANVDSALFGISDAKHIPSSISLPQSLEQAITQAVKETQKDGLEHGGVVTSTGKPPNASFHVWDPIAGTNATNPPTVHAAGSAPDSEQQNIIGLYHTHPDKNGQNYDQSYTVLSRNDIIDFVSNGYTFYIMTNCNGSETTVVVALASINRNSTAKGYNPSRPVIDFNPFPQDLSENQQYQYWEEQQLNNLSGVGQQVGFAVYKRTKSTGQLKLVQYDANYPDTEPTRAQWNKMHAQ